MTKPVQDNEALLNLLIEHGDQIQSLGVQSLGLFGSFARDEAIHLRAMLILSLTLKPGRKLLEI